MKKLILSISLLILVACTPPMKSESNQCKYTPEHCCEDQCKCTLEHCCVDTVTVEENFFPYPKL